MRPRPAPPGFDDWDRLLALIQRSFAAMEGRIDPPSSARLLSTDSLRARAARERLYILPDLSACAFLAEQPDSLYIGKLAVAPEAQRRGLGRAVIAEAEALARRPGLPRLRLETRVEPSRTTPPSPPLASCGPPQRRIPATTA